MQLSIKQIREENELVKILKLRYEVFCIEQKVPIDEEIDHFDILDLAHDDVLHYGVYQNNEVVASLRVLNYQDYLKIGRVVTKRTHRNQGIIAKLFEVVLSDLFFLFPKKRKIVLESQKHVIAMYQKFGFIAEGDYFYDANILHKKMTRQNISPFLYTHTNKRYYAFNHYLKNTYSHKVGRVMLDGGFSCPNIDGTKSRGGCTFCSVRGSGDFAGERIDPLEIQFEKNYARLLKKWPNAKAIAYFQNYSNTHDTIENLKLKYEVFVDNPEVDAIAIGTRPDCLDEEKIQYLAELSLKKDLILELGLQTINDETSDKINRAHTHQEFDDCLTMLEKYNIKPVIHIINGLPGETKDDMMATAKYLAGKKISGIKIHLLHILKSTKMAKQYENNEFEAMEFKDYLDVVVDQLEILPPNLVIHRLTGDGKSEDLIAPLWANDKTIVLNDIDKLLVARQTYQGRLYEAK